MAVNTTKVNFENKRRMSFQKAYSKDEDGTEKIESCRMAGILEGLLGKPVHKLLLDEYIRRLDPDNTEFLDRKAYEEIVDKFVAKDAGTGNV